jgi:hypothetical protein
VSAGDATTIASLKCVAAGGVNLGIALALGASWPQPGRVATAACIGLLGYGVSLALFVAALRQMGATRTSAHFPAPLP